MSKIQSAFAKGKAFMVFITCGDPDLATTEAAVYAATEAGADLIELGIPFSDPTAEGPVMEQSSLRALQGGVTTDKIFAMAKRLRRKVNVPIVFMTYANVVFSYGAEVFIGKCAELSIDGLILPDIPYEEKDEFLPLCRQYGVDLISVITSASADRIPMIVKEATGFIYVLSGSEATITKEVLQQIVQEVRKNSSIPCVVSGVGNLEQDRRIAEFTDGIIADTAIVELLSEYDSQAPEYIGEYVRNVKAVIK